MYTKFRSVLGALLWCFCSHLQEKWVPAASPLAFFLSPAPGMYGDGGSQRMLYKLSVDGLAPKWWLSYLCLRERIRCTSRRDIRPLRSSPAVVTTPVLPAVLGAGASCASWSSLRAGPQLGLGAGLSTPVPLGIAWELWHKCLGSQLRDSDTVELVWSLGNCSENSPGECSLPLGWEALSWWLTLSERGN